MTATGDLRRMLDERGVKWKPKRGRKHDGTEWRDQFGTNVEAVQEYTWDGSERLEGKLLIGRGSSYLTPAQAIAATLGVETCHLEEIDKDCDTASEYMLDREWCFDAVYRCSCGCRFGHVAHDRPRYCPNCGRRIEVDE